MRRFVGCFCWQPENVHDLFTHFLRFPPHSELQKHLSPHKGSLCKQRFTRQNARSSQIVYILAQGNPGKTTQGIFSGLYESIVQVCLISFVFRSVSGFWFMTFLRKVFVKEQLAQIAPCGFGLTKNG